MSSHFFSPSGLTRSRFYSSGGAFSAHRLQETNNLTILYTLMGTNIAVFGYAMYLKQQVMVRNTLLNIRIETIEVTYRSTSNPTQ
jgi:hypothetical protein